MASASVTFKTSKLKKAFETPDEWVGLYNKKQQNLKCDEVTIRMGETTIQTKMLAISIGNDICDLLDWKGSDKVFIQRSRIRPNLIRLTKSTVPAAYKLGANKVALNKLYVKFKMEDGKYLLDQTFKTEYELDSDSKALIIDISQLMA